MTATPRDCRSFELPAIHARRPVPEVQALMVGQIERSFRIRASSKVGWRPNDRPPLLFRHAHGHHVSLEEVPEMNAGLEPRAAEIDAAQLGGRHAEHDVRVLARESRQPR